MHFSRRSGHFSRMVCENSSFERLLKNFYNAVTTSWSDWNPNNVELSSSGETATNCTRWYLDCMEDAPWCQCFDFPAKQWLTLWHSLAFSWWRIKLCQLVDFRILRIAFNARVERCLSSSMTSLVAFFLRSTSSNFSYRFPSIRVLFMPIHNHRLV